MKIAVISDVHSNLFALAAVINDIKRHNVDLTVCLGDLVGYCTFPNKVINLIRGLNISTVMGKYDEAVGNELTACINDYPDHVNKENESIALNWTINVTTEDNKIFLRELPKEMVMVFGNKTIRFVHRETGKLSKYLNGDSPDVDTSIEELTEDILIYGHTHKPFYKRYGDKVLINPGSVGSPKTGMPKANYVVLSKYGNDIRVEIIEVPYDYEKTASAIEQIGLPKEYAKLIRTGKA